VDGSALLWDAPARVHRGVELFVVVGMPSFRCYIGDIRSAAETEGGVTVVYMCKLSYTCLAPSPFWNGLGGVSRSFLAQSWHLEKSSTPRSELGFRVSNT
jgi:hypothetical protein